MARKGGTPEERPALTRDLIVATALALVERDGAKALSMRRIAAELGAGTMSLYNHVPDRDSLVEAMAREVFAGLDVPPPAPGTDWKETARALVAAFGVAARRHPRSMYLVLTSRVGLEVPWRTAEGALAVLVGEGFDGATSVRVLRALMSFAIGAQMMVEGALKMPDEPEAAAHFRALGIPEGLLCPDLEGDFAIGLELLLSALDRLPRTRP
ncbi:TetR family transcriptional regulator [Actinocorallia sp. API 0066]|uniref:TetR/AcrR family transcriptional regulator n=1 Tax=Actinocorallia sp. API 0066 TaxID=2896846 RepID=UPI001E2BD5EF|nr:TetR family transcriptional regulator [Actinocorallia sp. API 0066]MCD0452667.1 TetR family transcriptional regulator [Actinocorallia sp. API 0066]